MLRSRLPITDRQQTTPKGNLTDEFKAQFRDAVPEVRVWVRNLPRKATSFYLRTSKDWFHPDFLCQLTDDRVLAVEYKGKHLYDAGGEKCAVGAVWSPFPRVNLRRTPKSA